MGNKLFLHEHIAGAKTASVYRDLETNKYWVIGYRQSAVELNEVFRTEHEAEDYAEDWVLQPE